MFRWMATTVVLLVLVAGMAWAGPSYTVNGDGYVPVPVTPQAAPVLAAPIADGQVTGAIERQMPPACCGQPAPKPTATPQAPDTGQPTESAACSRG